MSDDGVLVRCKVTPYDQTPGAEWSTVSEDATLTVDAQDIVWVYGSTGAGLDSGLAVIPESIRWPDEPWQIQLYLSLKEGANTGNASAILINGLSATSFNWKLEVRSTVNRSLVIAVAGSAHAFSVGLPARWVYVIAGWDGANLFIEIDGVRETTPLASYLPTYTNDQYHVFSSEHDVDGVQVSRISIRERGGQFQVFYPCNEGRGLVWTETVQGYEGILTSENIHAPSEDLPPLWSHIPDETILLSEALTYERDMNDYVASVSEITAWTTSRGEITQPSGGGIWTPEDFEVGSFTSQQTATNAIDTTPGNAWDLIILVDAPVWTPIGTIQELDDNFPVEIDLDEYCADAENYTLLVGDGEITGSILSIDRGQAPVAPHPYTVEAENTSGTEEVSFTVIVDASDAEITLQPIDTTIEEGGSGSFLIEVTHPVIDPIPQGSFSWWAKAYEDDDWVLAQELLNSDTGSSYASEFLINVAHIDDNASILECRVQPYGFANGRPGAVDSVLVVLEVLGDSYDTRVMTVGNDANSYGYDGFALYGDLVPDDGFIRFQTLTGGTSIRIQLPGYTVPDNSIFQIYTPDNPGLGVIQLPPHSSLTDAWAASGQTALDLHNYLLTELGNEITWRMRETLGIQPYTHIMTVGNDGSDWGFKRFTSPHGSITPDDTNYLEIMSWSGTHMRVRKSAVIPEGGVIYISIIESGLEPLIMGRHSGIFELYQSNSALALQYVTFMESQADLTLLRWNLDEFLPEAVGYSFDADFDGATTFVEEGSFTSFSYFGVNGQGTDWITDTAAIPVCFPFGNGTFYGNQGTAEIPDDSIYELVLDPNGSGDQVAYWELVQDPGDNIGRQSFAMMINAYRDGITTEQQLEQIYTSQRVRLSTGYQEIENLPQAVPWLMLYESFANRENNTTCSRFNFNIHKDAGAGPAYFNTRMTYYNDGGSEFPLWSEQSAVDIPIEEWFTLEVFFRKGGLASGRCWIAITPDGGSQQIVCDVKNRTQHPFDPDRTESWMFMKNYTIGDLVDEMSQLGHPLAQWWGELHIDNTTDPTGD